MSNFLVFAGAICAGLAVILGAFGAHALASRLTPEKRHTFEIGVRYHFYHSLGLVAVGFAGPLLGSSGLLTATGLLFLLGIVLFSGSLYWLALDGPRWLGPVTPLGGLALIVGWVLLAVAAL